MPSTQSSRLTTHFAQRGCIRLGPPSVIVLPALLAAREPKIDTVNAPRIAEPAAQVVPFPLRFIPISDQDRRGDPLTNPAAAAHPILLQHRQCVVVLDER